MLDEPRKLRIGMLFCSQFWGILNNFKFLPKCIFWR
jgi:hypothetical protein